MASSAEVIIRTVIGDSSLKIIGKGLLFHRPLILQADPEPRLDAPAGPPNIVLAHILLRFGAWGLGPRIQHYVTCTAGGPANAGLHTKTSLYFVRGGKQGTGWTQPPVTEVGFPMRRQKRNGDVRLRATDAAGAIGDRLLRRPRNGSAHVPALPDRRWTAGLFVDGLV